MDGASRSSASDLSSGTGALGLLVVEPNAKMVTDSQQQLPGAPVPESDESTTTNPSMEAAPINSNLPTTPRHEREPGHSSSSSSSTSSPAVQLATTIAIRVQDVSSGEQSVADTTLTNDCCTSRGATANEGTPEGGVNDGRAAANDAGSTEPSSATTKKEEKRVGCAHYKRRAKFVTPCCNKLYNCRYCHDENESHYFNRKTVTQLICTECDTRQRVQAECEKCGVRFGKYTCLVCNLFDDEDKNQYHCDGCGICRVGGKDRFFHCAVCNMCLPIQLKIDGHRCVENVSRSNCPVCLEDIHTSRIPCHIPDCGHLLHRTCFEELLSSGHYACPTCQTSMIDMKKLWDYLDAEVENTPMPNEYAAYLVDILCKDCHKESNIPYHVVGLKCAHCGGYNTCQTNRSGTEQQQPQRPAGAPPPPPPNNSNSPSDGAAGGRGNDNSGAAPQTGAGVPSSSQS